MNCRSKNRNQIFQRFACLLLIIATLLAPMVSVMAEQHESKHVSSGDQHFNTSSNHNTVLSSNQASDIDESALHFLAHASHCCGHVVALLPNMFDLSLMSAKYALNIKRQPSSIFFLKISHFRPPILL